MIFKKLEHWLGSAELKKNFDQAHKPLGSLHYDRWGYHQDSAYLAAAFIRQMYEKYFHVEAFGREHLPTHGRAMIVGNHSGYLPLDAALVGYSLLTNPYGSRVPRAMTNRLFSAIPYIGNLFNKIGAVSSEAQNCHDLLSQDEAVLVFPEGLRGPSKGFAKRYQLQRFGNGFMHIAIETKTPIIPVGIVGCEEALPMFGNAKGLAQRFNLPFFPITLPFLIPAKVTLVFGEPLYFEGPIHCEEDLEAKVHIVKAKIRQLIQTGQSKQLASS